MGVFVGAILGVKYASEQISTSVKSAKDRSVFMCSFDLLIFTPFLWLLPFCLLSFFSFLYPLIFVRCSSFYVRWLLAMRWCAGTGIVDDTSVASWWWWWWWWWRGDTLWDIICHYITYHISYDMPQLTYTGQMDDGSVGGYVRLLRWVSLLSLNHLSR